MEQMIGNLKKKGLKVGIITDGRPEGQRNKITALGLEDLVDDFIITDELGGPQFRKPCDIAFRIMAVRWKLPYEKMIYVGDNTDKDFQAPQQLGMWGVWIQNPEGLHVEKKNDKDCVSIKNISQLATFLALISDKK